MFVLLRPKRERTYDYNTSNGHIPHYKLTVSVKLIFEYGSLIWSVQTHDAIGFSVCYS